jgi:hypothetical protein
MSISYERSIVRSWVASAPSVRGLAGHFHDSPPISLRSLLGGVGAVESVTREIDINTSDDSPINGHVGFTARSDGTYEFFGHMRATGFPSYHYGVSAWLDAGDGTVITGLRTGHVYGTDTPGPRQDDWSEKGFNAAIAVHW